jgi:pentatricopeptide repeat protein
MSFTTHDVMSCLGVASNEVTYTMLIHGYFIHGHIEMGVALFDSGMVQDRGVEQRLSPIPQNVCERCRALMCSCICIGWRLS